MEKIKKISHSKFMNAMNDKKVTLMYGGVIGKNVLEKAIKSLDDGNNYRKVVSAPINKTKYMGVFHKRSHGFYRVMSDGTKSYKEFSKGDYILSDGKISFIITPNTMLVCMYRTED